MVATEVKQLEHPPEPGYGALESDRGGLPLQDMEVEAHIVGLLYRLEVRQTFVNAHPVPLEATYIFPLPARAGVSRFRLEVGDRVIDGTLQERGQARAEYDRAVSQGRRAAIAEEERSDVFTVRAGNIPCGEKVTVVLELSGPLAYLDDEATFRFPLVVAQRYIPGLALAGPAVGSGTAADTDAVPDASRITPPVLLPGQPNPVHLSLTVNIDPAGLTFGPPRSSLHDVVVEPGRVTLRPGVERLDRDFVLHLPVLGEGLQSSFVASPDGQGEVTFLLTVVPPSLKRCGVRPRDVVVVLDRSGSMKGWRMASARRAAIRILESLTEHDKFAVVAFDDQLEMPFAQLRRADPWSVQQATEFLNRVEARGATHLAGALTRAAQLLRFDNEAREASLVVVTDGQVGNEEQLVGRFHSPQGFRIFTVGIDQAVNEGLLRRLAENSGGVCFLVETRDRLETALRGLHHRLGHPAVMDVKLRDLVALDSTPTPCDAFPGSPAFLFGKLGAVPDGPIRVRGLTGAGAYEVSLPVHRREDSLLTTAWARARILDLQDHFAAGADLAAGITAFSLQWGVLSRFTAFVACDEVQAVSRTVPVVRTTVPVERRRQPDRVCEPAPPAYGAGMFTPRSAGPADGGVSVAGLGFGGYGSAQPVGFGMSFGPVFFAPSVPAQNMLELIQRLIEVERKLTDGWHHFQSERGEAVRVLLALLAELLAQKDEPVRLWRVIDAHLFKHAFSVWARPVVVGLRAARARPQALPECVELVAELSRRYQ